MGFTLSEQSGVSDRLEEMDPATVKTKRALIWRDGFTFAVLTLIAVAMYVITSLLFHSFERHRDSLGRQWTAKARASLAQGKPDEAVDDLRTALSFAPDDRANTELLAEALTAAGRNEQAANYYLGLWEQRPGDGLINLQLARVMRRAHRAGHFAFRGGIVYKDDPSVAEKAVDYYRAAIYGTWENDALRRRREVRMELADYLIGLQKFPQAKEELLILAGNTPESAAFDEQLASAFQSLGDPDDALRFFKRAAEFDPKSMRALNNLVEYAFGEGEFDVAGKYLRTLSQREVKTAADKEMREKLQAKQELVGKILELDPNTSPADRRATRLVLDARLAQRRLSMCIASVGRDGTGNESLLQMERDWKGTIAKAAELAEDASAMQALESRIFDTYKITSLRCGTPLTLEDKALETLNAIRMGKAGHDK